MSLELAEELNVVAQEMMAPLDELDMPAGSSPSCSDLGGSGSRASPGDSTSGTSGHGASGSDGTGGSHACDEGDQGLRMSCKGADGATCDEVTVFPRRKTGQDKMGSARPPIVITRKMLEGFFHMPQHVVCDKLGICATVIKKICRMLGIKKWPFKANKSKIRKGARKAQEQSELACQQEYEHSQQLQKHVRSQIQQYEQAALGQQQQHLRPIAAGPVNAGSPPIFITSMTSAGAGMEHSSPEMWGPSVQGSGNIYFPRRHNVGAGPARSAFHPAGSHASDRAALDEAPFSHAGSFAGQKRSWGGPEMGQLHDDLSMGPNAYGQPAERPNYDGRGGPMRQRNWSQQHESDARYNPYARTSSQQMPYRAQAQLEGMYMGEAPPIPYEDEVVSASQRDDQALQLQKAMLIQQYRQQQRMDEGYHMAQDSERIDMHEALQKAMQWRSDPAPQAESLYGGSWQMPGQGRRMECSMGEAIGCGPDAWLQ